MIRDLVKSDANILHHEIKPCGVNVDRHFIAKTLIENMHHYEGVGLSANQIGMDVRAFAMIRDIEHNEVIVCFNPVILCLLYTSPSPRDKRQSRMPSSA